MNFSLLRTQRMIIRKFPSLLNIRHASYRKFGQDRKVRKILGTVGLGTILVASYMLTRADNKGGRTKTQDTKKPINHLVDGPNLKLISSESKENSIREKYNFINKVVKKCAPAVFYLEIRDPFRKDLETGEPIITSNGSGFLINEDGWALTNAHVVVNKPQSTITAVMRDGSSYKVHVEDADMNLDLALLKLDCPEKLPSLKFSKPGDTSIGEWVVALGSPLSLSNSVTVGIVSCVNRPAEDLGLRNFSMSYIQTDASVTFGNSGGPLVNLDGDVIGINNLRLTSGISFAIPVEYVQKFLENSKFRVKRGQNVGIMGKSLFGITTISITPDILDDLTDEYKNIPSDISQGLLVWKIVEGTPASESGMEVGDIITHVNGVPVKEPAEIYLSQGLENQVEISLLHKGKKKIVKLNV